MKQITRITPELIRVRLVHTSLGTDGPLGALIVQEYMLNEYEFRKLQLEVCKDEWEGYSISYSGTQDGKQVCGILQEDGIASVSLDILALNTQYTVEMLKHCNVRQQRAKAKETIDKM